VTVYQGAFEAFRQKKLFEFIKEDGLVLLGELFFFEQETLPTLTESSVFVQQGALAGGETGLGADFREEFSLKPGDLGSELKIRSDGCP
jgi:hypothetical protein